MSRCNYPTDDDYECKCCALDPCTPLDLTLTNAFNNVSDFEEFQVQLSQDGSLAYVASAQATAPFNDVNGNAQALYTNVNGNLIPILVQTVADIQALSPNYAGYTVSAGVASADFNIFALLILPPVTSGTAAPVIGYILFFDRGFNLITTYEYDNVLNQFPFMNASQYAFTPDNRYFVYATSVYALNPPVPGLIQVLDITYNPPQVVASVQDSSTLSYSPGPIFFSLNEGREWYIVNGTSTLSGSNFLTVSTVAAHLVFYSFNPSTGSVAQVGPLISQPQSVGAAVPFISPSGRSVNVVVGCALAVNAAGPTGPFEPSVYNVSNGEDNTLIPGDNRNLRIYNFNGKRAKLIYAKHLDTSIGTVAWYPNGKEFALLLGAGGTNLVNGNCSNFYPPSTSPNVVQLFTFNRVDNENVTVRPASVAITAPPSAILDFSANGKWFLVGGGGTISASAINSTSLYAVSKNEICY